MHVVVTLADIQNKLAELAPEKLQVHYLINLSKTAKNKRGKLLEKIKRLIHAKHEKGKQLPPWLSQMVLGLYTAQGENPAPEQGTCVYSYTVPAYSHLLRSLDLRQIPQKYREEALRIARRILKSGSLHESYFPPHLKQLQPRVLEILLRREWEKPQSALQTAEKQVNYLASVLKQGLLTPHAKKHAAKLIRRKARKIARIHLQQGQPGGAAEAYAKTNAFRKGAEHLLQEGHEWWAAQLFSRGEIPLIGAGKLAATRPDLAAELFTEAKKPLQGARTLIDLHKPKTSHAFYAGELFKQANAHEEGIKAMQRIGRTDLAKEIERHKNHAEEYRRYRRTTDEFKAVRLARLTGKHRKAEK